MVAAAPAMSQIRRRLSKKDVPGSATDAKASAKVAGGEGTRKRARASSAGSFAYGAAR